MKHTKKTIALAILCAFYAQIAINCSSCDTLKSRYDCSSCTKEEVTKACPCSQPKPPQDQTTRPSRLENIQEEEKGCSCSQPKPPKPTTKACPCSLPRPPKPKDNDSKVTAEIAVGELVDKITILQIKSENIKDPEKLANIHRELDSLTDTLSTHIQKSDKLDELAAELLDINKQLWNIEDDIRDKERVKEFDDEFVTLARAVYYTNDERCAVKRKINDLTGSRLQEEKSYQDYITI